MDIKITYPPMKKKSYFWRAFCLIYNILFAISIFLLPLINILCGGKPWSLLALMGIFTGWSLFISPTRFEINRIYQTIKATIYVLIILIIIELFFRGGWAIFVMPIVASGGITLCAILFFSNFEKQRHHSFTLLWFTMFCFIGGLICVFLDVVLVKWVYIMLSGCSFALLIAMVATLKGDIIDEIKKNFNTK